jgi:hypothetical protein
MKTTVHVTIFRSIVFSLLGVALSSCGGDVETTQNPQTILPPTSSYNGPPPATADVQSFRVNVWENLRTSNRCGTCHDVGGQGTTSFVRQDDVNLAYAAANTVVDLQSPFDSLMVTKVAGGHNCWLTDNQACADIIQTYIEAWANDVGAGGGRTIQLIPPTLQDPGTSRNFPVSSAMFGSTVHPLLTTFCAGCHAPSALVPQAPFFADADVDAAYEAAKSKMNLDDPADSRFVVRLRNEFHNCWAISGAVDCPGSADRMETEIAAFAGQILPTQVDPTLFFSKALTLFEGTLASGGNRYEANQIALWEFKTGQGTTAFDTSGFNPAIDLTLSGTDVTWQGGYGINIRDGKAQGSTTASAKLHDMILLTGEYAIETWAAPANVTQEDTRIVSYSGGTQARNFNLGQTLYNYDAFNRTVNSGANGDPALSTADADEDLQATLQHVVVNYDPVNGRSIYVNGVWTDDIDPAAGEALSGWDNSFAFVLGNEVSGDRQWQGVIRLAAIHNRVLTPAQIQQNFDVGVGQKFFLLFSVGDLINLPDSYIMFEVSQFDSYSYRFIEPTFINLDPSVLPGNIPLMGMRIGVNGAEAEVGQAYANLDMAISDSLYTPQSGQLLSRLGTVIGLEKGPAQDEFFLTFEILGSNQNVKTPVAPLQPGPPPILAPMPDIGVRTFEEINATMSEVTTVPTTQSDVQLTYETVKQQLPTAENIDGFLSAHQVGIAQLAIEYCNALVDDTNLRSQYFPGFNFTQTANAAFDPPANRDVVLDPLLNNIMNIGLATQPDVNEAKIELDGLINTLTLCGGGACPAGRTELVVKSVCTATIGNGSMLIQ